MIEGSFIVLEGIDGAGTTTQSARLAARFGERGLPMVVTREPTTGPIGSLIRQALTHRLVVPGVQGGRPPSWKTMALLFAADRLDHLEAEILPNLMDGVSVVTDRYDLSSLAYQSVSAEDDGASVPWIRTLNQHARRPDLTVVLDVSAATAQKRRVRRGGAAELYEVSELQAHLADAYRNAEKLVPGDRVVHVDGEQTPDAVERDVYAAVLALRGERLALLRQIRRMGEPPRRQGRQERQGLRGRFSPWRPWRLGGSFLILPFGEGWADR